MCWTFQVFFVIIHYGFLQMHLPVTVFVSSIFWWDRICSCTLIIFSGQLSDLLSPHLDFSATVWILYPGSAFFLIGDTHTRTGNSLYLISYRYPHSPPHPNTPTHAHPHTTTHTSVPLWVPSNAPACQGFRFFQYFDETECAALIIFSGQQSDLLSPCGFLSHCLDSLPTCYKPE